MCQCTTSNLAPGTPVCACKCWECSPLCKLFRFCILGAETPKSPWNNMFSVVSLTCLQVLLRIINLYPDLRQGLQSSWVFFFFFLAHTGTHSLNTKMKMLRFTGLPFMKTSFESDPFKDEAAQRVTVCFFPRLLQCSLHAWQLLGMLFLAALQPTKTSNKASVRAWMRSQKIPFSKATWRIRTEIHRNVIYKYLWCLCSELLCWSRFIVFRPDHGYQDKCPPYIQQHKDYLNICVHAHILNVHMTTVIEPHFCRFISSMYFFGWGSEAYV